MRFVILPLFLLTITTAGAKDRHEALMDEIESSIVLPPGALPLRSYARYYTEYRGAIHGAYTTAIEQRPADFGCSQATADMKLKDVPCPAIADLQVGNRRWVRFRDYPAFDGRNCSAVQIMFDPKTKSFDYLACSEANH